MKSKNQSWYHILLFNSRNLPERVIQAKFQNLKWRFYKEYVGKLPTNIPCLSCSSNKNRLDNSRLDMTNCEVFSGSCCTGLCGLSTCYTNLQSALGYLEDRKHYQPLILVFIKSNEFKVLPSNQCGNKSCLGNLLPGQVWALSF